MRANGLCVGLATAAFAVPGAAQAATVELRTLGVGPAAQLVVTDTAGEVNRQTLSVVPGPNGGATSATVRDESAILVPVGGCTAVDGHTVTCEAEVIWGLLVELGPGEDSATFAPERAREWEDGRIEGGDGDDRIKSPGRLEGEAGNDTLTGARSADLLYGGPGRDVLTGSGRDDSLHGGAGNDVLRGGPDGDLMYGGAYGFSGNPGRDRLYGDGGADDLDDGDGSRWAGPDLIDGGEGGDADTETGDIVLSYDTRTRPVRVDLAEPRPAGEKGEGDVLRHIESADGGRANDVLRGTREPNELRGNGGRDSIRARDGADRVFFGGADRVHTGGGADLLAGDPSSTPRLACGKGPDVVQAGFDPRKRASISAGPLLMSDCERFGGVDVDGEVVIEVAPHPAWRPGARRLRFRVFDLPCCGTRATLTRPRPPFRRIASAALTSDPLKIRFRSRKRTQTLRMSIEGFGSEEVREDAKLMWRFRIG